MIKDSIFIPIAACEERFIEHTIKSALNAAFDSTKIYFGVFNNIIKKEHSLLNNDFINNNSQIFYTEIVTKVPMGTGFGRMNASLLQFDDFEYIFQIDAHTFFSKNWDKQLIDIFNKIKDKENIDENKIVLSAVPSIMWLYDSEYPEQFLSPDFLENKYISIDPYNLEEKLLDKVEKGLTIPGFVYDGKQGDVTVQDNIGFPIVYGRGPLGDFEYIEVNGIHASFMFSKIDLVRDVLHDPEDVFNGDQTNYSIRLLSRGYKIFCPKYPTIATLNKVKINKKVANKFYQEESVDPEYNWRDFYRDGTAESYWRHKFIKGEKSFKDIISGNYFGYWGAPDKESLKFTKKKIDYPE